jgi:predicted metalloprotease with PDZ domain
LWLEVDTLIRQETKGERSLDDFCRRFHGGTSGPACVKPYTFDDIVSDLNAVAPYDWKALLRRRVGTPAEGAPLEGLHRGGWKLTYSDKPSEFYGMQEEANKGVDLAADLGLRLGSDGAVTDVIPEKAADKAGLAPGMKLVAVNGRRWSTQLLHTAVAATKTSAQPLELLVENEEYFRTYRLDYHEGAKYPRLERDTAREDLLSLIFKPRAPAGKP